MRGQSPATNALMSTLKGTFPREKSWGLLPSGKFCANFTKKGCSVHRASSYYTVQIRITACFLRSTLTRSTMAFCNYSTLVGGNCGPSSENPANVECVTIGLCTKEVNGHLTFCKVSDDVGVDSESKLLLARAGRVSAL